MESIISTFHIDWKIIIAQMVNFAIVFVVLYIFALKPLSKLMTERSEKIAKGLEDAKSNASMLAKSKEEYEAAILQGKKEADKIFKEGKKEALIKRNEMLESTRVEMEKMIEDGRKTLEGEKIKMVEEARKEIVSLTMKSVEKVLAKKPDTSYDERVIKELINS